MQFAFKKDHVVIAAITIYSAKVKNSRRFLIFPRKQDLLKIYFSRSAKKTCFSQNFETKYLNAQREKCTCLPTHRLSWWCRITWELLSSLTPEDVFDDTHQTAYLCDDFLLHEIEAHGNQSHSWKHKAHRWIILDIRRMKLNRDYKLSRATIVRIVARIESAARLAESSRISPRKIWPTIRHWSKRI